MIRGHRFGAEDETLLGNS